MMITAAPQQPVALLVPAITIVLLPTANGLRNT
jgi:hypothetical protein